MGGDGRVKVGQDVGRALHRHTDCILSFRSFVDLLGLIIGPAAKHRAGSQTGGLT